MLWFIKRLLQLVPVLFALTIFTFFVGKFSNTDAVDALLSSEKAIQNQRLSVLELEKERAELRQKIGLNKPTFYFQVQSANHSLAVNEFSKEIQKIINKWAWLGYNSNDVVPYFQQLIQEIKKQPELAVYLYQPDFNLHKQHYAVSENKTLKILFSRISDNRNIAQSFVPKLSFTTNNQYHEWLFGAKGKGGGVLKGDFGKSYISQVSVAEIILPKLAWSLKIGFISLLISYLISIPVGLFLVYNYNKYIAYLVKIGLYILYASPSFWMATLLLWVFANPNMFDWFPMGGIPPKDAGFFQSVSYLLLPLFCFSYASLAFISRMVSTNIQSELKKTYCRAAFARGLSFKTIVNKYAFKNTLFPLITMFGAVFPTVISGSIVIETIFNLPGIGFEFYKASQSLDYPVLMAIVLIMGSLSFVGYWLSDVLYQFADPRSNKNNLDV